MSNSRIRYGVQSNQLGAKIAKTKQFSYRRAGQEVFNSNEYDANAIGQELFLEAVARGGDLKFDISITEQNGRVVIDDKPTETTHKFELLNKESWKYKLTKV